MTAEAFLTELLSSGFALSATGGNLRVSPASQLTDEQRAVIKNHKAAIIGLLIAGQNAVPRLAAQSESRALLTAQPESPIAEPIRSCDRCSTPMERIEFGYQSCPNCHFQRVEPRSGFWVASIEQERLAA